MTKRTSRRKVRYSLSLSRVRRANGGLNVEALFGVPLELLVEREGADSLHGASRAALRVPSFIDDVISAMRQMGASLMLHIYILIHLANGHPLCRRYVG